MGGRLRAIARRQLHPARFWLGVFRPMKPTQLPARRCCAPTGLPLICAALTAGALFVAGCASTTEVKIDSLSKPKAEEVISYSIHNNNPLVAEDSLRYKEAVGFVKTALSGKGLYEAPDAQKADIVVSVDYGVSPPEVRRETVPEPIYRTKPGAVHTEPIQIGTDPKGNPIYGTATQEEPTTTEIIGYRDRVTTSIVYEKYLRLSARDNKPVAEGVPPTDIWTIDAACEGESHDLRANLPLIVAATIDYIGKDTHGQKTIRIKDSNPDVAFVKKGL